VKNYHSGLCLRCGNGFGAHNGHICPFIGGRGSFKNDSGSDEKKKTTPLQMVRALTDTEAAKFRPGGGEALPASRVAVYAAHEHLKEEDRQAFWELGVLVTEDPRQLIAWSTSIPQWGAEEAAAAAADSEAAVDDDALGDMPDVPPPLLKRESSTAENMKLAEYRAELEEIEHSKAVFADQEDSARKELQHRAIANHRLLVTLVDERVDVLQRALDSLAALAGPAAADLEQRKPSSNPNSGRDSALALAWVDHNPRADFASFGPEVVRHAHSLRNEIYSLKQMLLAVKVVAYVTSPLHKKLLNLSHSWLRTFLPHCLAKINRVSFGLLSSEHCAAALKADPHCPRSRLKLAVPFVGKDVPSKSSEFAHPDITIGLTILAYRCALL
jgi:hypothetical protein